jgi:UDP-N-acetyl-D-galactosamine dehydrogenase
MILMPGKSKKIGSGRKICVVGLGYVGLPLALEFGKKAEVNGYDIDEKRISELKRGHDRTLEISATELKGSKINFTSDPGIISESDFIIAAIPTPVDKSKRPDLGLLKEAARTIGKNLRKGSTVVFESTVYPGVTEDVCVPIMERESGLKCGKDFKAGYSPERINPGDKQHTVVNIVKVVAGCDKESLEAIAKVYETIVKAGVYKAPSIRVAEAAKVIENVQRDINISLMNELKIIFDKMGIDTEEVLSAARTKWNFLDFRPGLVGGHCIGIDPYYLAYKAEIDGHHPEMILAGRRINDDMPKYVVSRIMDDMISKGIHIKGAKVLVLGASFKPDVKDLRNSKIEDVVKGMVSHGCSVHICEPMVDDQKKIFGCANISQKECEKNNYDYVVLAVKHKLFKNTDVEKRVDYSI